MRFSRLFKRANTGEAKKSSRNGDQPTRTSKWALPRREQKLPKGEDKANQHLSRFNAKSFFSKLTTKSNQPQDVAQSTHYTYMRDVLSGPSHRSSGEAVGATSNQEVKLESKIGCRESSASDVDTTLPPAEQPKPADQSEATAFLYLSIKEVDGDDGNQEDTLYPEDDLSTLGKASATIASSLKHHHKDQHAYNPDNFPDCGEDKSSGKEGSHDSKPLKDIRTCAAGTGAETALSGSLHEHHDDLTFGPASAERGSEIASVGLAVKVILPGQSSVLITREWFDDFQRYKDERSAQNKALKSANNAKADCKSMRKIVDMYMHRCEILQDLTLDRSITYPTESVRLLRNVLSWIDTLGASQVLLDEVDEFIDQAIRTLEMQYLKIEAVDDLCHEISDCAHDLDSSCHSSRIMPPSIRMKIDGLFTKAEDVVLDHDGWPEAHRVEGSLKSLSYSLEVHEWSHLLGPRQHVKDDLALYTKELSCVGEKLDSVDIYAPLSDTDINSPSKPRDEALFTEQLLVIKLELEVHWYFLMASESVAKERVKYIPDTRCWDDDYVQTLNEDMLISSHSLRDDEPGFYSVGSSSDWIACPNDQEHFAVGCRHCRHEPFLDPLESSDEAIHSGDHKIESWMAQVTGQSDCMESPEIDDWPFREANLCDNNFDGEEEYLQVFAVLEGIKSGYLEQSAEKGYVKTFKYPVPSRDACLLAKGAPGRFLIEAYGQEMAGGWCPSPPSPHMAAAYFAIYNIIHVDGFSQVEVDDEQRFEENGILLDDVD